MGIRLTDCKEFSHSGTTLNSSWIRSPKRVMFTSSFGREFSDQFSVNKALLHIIKTIGI